MGEEVCESAMIDSVLLMQDKAICDVMGREGRVVYCNCICRIRLKRFRQVSAL